MYKAARLLLCPIRTLATYKYIPATLCHAAATAYRIADAPCGDAVDINRAAPRCNRSSMWRMDRTAMRRIGIAYAPRPFAVDKNIRAVTR